MVCKGGKGGNVGSLERQSEGCSGMTLCLRDCFCFATSMLTLGNCSSSTQGAQSRSSSSWGYTVKPLRCFHCLRRRAEWPSEGDVCPGKAGDKLNEKACILVCCDWSASPHDGLLPQIVSQRKRFFHKLLLVSSHLWEKLLLQVEAWKLYISTTCVRQIPKVLWQSSYVDLIPRWEWGKPFTVSDVLTLLVTDQMILRQVN